MAGGDKIFFNKIIVGDETWCFAYDPETKRQSSEWVGEPSHRSKKLKFRRSCIKTVLMIFFSSQDVGHKEFIPEEKTVNAEFYKSGIGLPPEAHSMGLSSCILLSRFFLVAR
jgi:hypothetical protein